MQRRCLWEVHVCGHPFGLRREEDHDASLELHQWDENARVEHNGHYPQRGVTNHKTIHSAINSIPQMKPSLCDDSCLVSVVISDNDA